MPQIPLYNDGSAVRTKPGQNAPISTGGRGVDISSAALMGAIEIPMLDDSGVMAEARGGAAIGQGLTAAGNALGGIAEIQARALNIKRVNEAQAGWAQRRAQIEAAQLEEPDETKWHAIAEKILGDEMPWMRPDLSPDARDEIEALNLKYGSLVREGTMVASARKTIQDVDNDAVGQWQAATNVGDTARAKAITRARLEAGKITSGQAEHLDSEADQAAERFARQQQADDFKQKTDHAITAVTTFGLIPTLEAIDAGDFGDDQSERESLRNTAKAVNADRQQEVVAAFTDRIFDPDPMKRASKADIDAADDLFLPDKVKAQLKSMVDQMNNADMKANIAANAPFYAAQLESAVRKYDVKQEENPDEALKYWDLWTRINSMPVGFRGTLHETLKRKRFPDKASANKVPTEVFMDVLESYFDQGSFGVFKGLSESDPDNPVEKRKALMRKGKAREEWLAWVADHPEAKVTDPETSKAMNEIVGRHVGAEFVAPIPMPSPEQSGPAPTVDDILKRYGAPPAEKTPGQAEIDAENERRAKEAKGKSIKEREREEGKGATTQVSVPYFEPDMPSGGGQPDANPLMTQPPPPESIDDDIRPPAGQSYMQVDEGVLSRLRSSGKQQIVYNRATKKWSKIDPGKVKAGDLLVVQ